MANKNKFRSWHHVKVHGLHTGATTACITRDTSLHAWKGLCRIRSVARQDKNVTAGWRCSILSASSEPATSAQAKFKIPPAIVCSLQCNNDARTFPNSVHLFIGKEKVEGFDVIDSLHDCPTGRCLPRCCVRCSLWELPLRSNVFLVSLSPCCILFLSTLHQQATLIAK